MQQTENNRHHTIKKFQQVWRRQLNTVLYPNEGTVKGSITRRRTISGMCPTNTSTGEESMTVHLRKLDREVQRKVHTLELMNNSKALKKHKGSR